MRQTSQGSIDAKNVSITNSNIFDPQDIANWFNLSQKILSIGTLVVLLVLPLSLSNPTERTVLIASLIILFLIIRIGNVFAQKGNYNYASWIYISSLYTTISLMLLVDGGIHDPGVDALFVLVILACFFLNRNGLLVVIVMTNVSLIATWYLENEGIINSTRPSFRDVNALVFPIIVIWVIAFLSRGIFKKMAERYAMYARLNSDLEKIVEERTTEMKIERDKAREGSEQMSSFLTNMSHEIRTPLTAIIGSADLLIDQSSPLEREETVGMIMKGSRRLMETLNSVLELTKLEYENSPMTQELVIVNEVISETIDLFYSKIMEKNLSIEQINDASLICEMNGAAFSRVFQNLLGNAIKYTETGGIRIHILDSSRGPEVRVIDTGIGISQDFLPKVFDKFSQESSGLARRHEGSGIGLSVAKQLMVNMGGDVSVTSRVEIGSVFTIHLPAIKSYLPSKGTAARKSVLSQ